MNRSYAYTFFSELYKLETNEYWKTVLLKCSNGKLPGKCGLRKDGKIMYLTNTRGISGQILLQGDPEIMLEVIKDAFKKHCKMSSPEENANNMQCLTKSKTSAEDIDWEAWNKLIKNKSILSSIVANHVLLLAKKYGLDVIEQDEIYRVLIVAISLGQVTSEDIKFKNGILIRVRNFVWDDQTRKGSVTYSIDKKVTTNKVVKKETMSTLWNTYLKANKKKRGK